MRTTVHVIAVTAFLLALADGCSLLEQRHHGSVKVTKLDLNTASRQQLESLPKLTSADVEHIIKDRPYEKKRELLDRKILDEQKFDAIRDDVEVSHPGR